MHEGSCSPLVFTHRHSNLMSSKVRSILSPCVFSECNKHDCNFLPKHHLLVHSLCWSAPGPSKQEEIVAEMRCSSFNCPSLTLMLTASVWCIFVPPPRCSAVLHLIMLKMHLRKYCCSNHPSWPAPCNIESPMNGILYLEPTKPSPLQIKLSQHNN